MWDQFSFAQIPINDQSLILRQQNIRTSIHPNSEWSKVPLETLHANNCVEVGDLVYFYSDRIVVVVENMWCKIRKFLKGSQLKGNFAKKNVYMFFLMYKYGCLYVYQRFIMLDKGMKSILKFCQWYMEVAILIESQYQASRDV